jgi:glycosyltransferase involved in cell wall biosynthesis
MAELLIPDHDMVLTHLIRAAEFGRSTHKINILEMTDAISLNYSRITSQKISFFDLRAFIYRIELSRLKRYEKSIVKDFNLSVLISEVDKRYLFGNNSNQNNLLVISNGVDASHFKFSFNPALGDIAFIGNMKSYQNYHAASYMATEILPIIRISFPDVRLRLIGRISLKAMEYFIKLDGVDITGEVRDINDAVIGCSVGVCPVTIGAGVQNKILEYMALGLPVVTTSVGAEGLNIASGAECLIANDPISFANAVINLLSDRKIAESLSLQGRTYIEKYHSWDYILNKYNNSVMTVFNDLEA